LKRRFAFTAENPASRKPVSVNSAFARAIFSTQKEFIFIFFSIFQEKILAAIFLVIGFKQGKSPTMGEKQVAVTLEFGKSGETGVSAHLAYVKHQHIAQSRRHTEVLQIKVVICR
jgi:hypothetical protein